MDPLIIGAILLMIASANKTAAAPAANPGTPGYKPAVPPLSPAPSSNQPKSGAGAGGGPVGPGSGTSLFGAKNNPGEGPILMPGPIPFSNDPSQFNVPPPDLTGAGAASAAAGFTGDISTDDVQAGDLLNSALASPSTSGVTLADPNAGLGDLAGGIDPLTGDLVNDVVYDPSGSGLLAGETESSSTGNYGQWGYDAYSGDPTDDEPGW